MKSTQMIDALEDRSGRNEFTWKFPKARIMHDITPLEFLPRLTRELHGPEILAKRDDLCGFGLGGNKVRQAEYYFGEAIDIGADTILSTSAVQSNHLRVVAAVAAKMGMRCIVQREDRVKQMPAVYFESGNALLQSLFGAEVLDYPEGEDEEGADARIKELAEKLRAEGRNPYVIHLGLDHPAIGALGYVDAALELLEQVRSQRIRLDAVVTASGSAATHAGLLCGLRAAGSQARVYGICVRRSRPEQEQRVWRRVCEISKSIGTSGSVEPGDILLCDKALGSGYGIPDASTAAAIDMLARLEALILDPVYTGKSMAGLIQLINSGELGADETVVYLHTGGFPAIFAYPDLLSDLRSHSAGKA